jgi:gas vesicle protein
VNKFLKALLKTGVYLLEQSDRVTTEMQDRVKDRVEDLTDRVGQAIHGQEDHTVRNAIWFAAGIGFGIGVGVLLAPTSGEETRSSISHKVQDMGDRVRERFSRAEKKPSTGTEG